MHNESTLSIPTLKSSFTLYTAPESGELLFECFCRSAWQMGGGRRSERKVNKSGEFGVFPRKVRVYNAEYFLGLSF
jgi:hypothetical protein